MSAHDPRSPVSHPSSRLVRLLGLVSLMLFPALLAGQSILRGGIEGTVGGGDGQPLGEAFVTLTEARGASAILTRTSRNGSFRFPQLPGGEYELRVELPGFRPQLFPTVQVQAGETIRLEIMLQPAAPPVVAVDTVMETSSSGRFYGGNRARISRWELAPGLARGMGMGELVARTPLMDEEMGSQGLPGALSAFALDGVPFTPARHPLHARGEPEFTLFPTLGMHAIDIHDGNDVEWGRSSANHVAVATRHARGGPVAEFFGSGSGGPLWHTSSPGEGTRPGTFSGWGGGTLQLPLAAGRSALFIAAEGSYIETPYRSPMSDSLATRFVESLPPSESLRADDLSSMWLNRVGGVSTSARFDWTDGATTRFMSRATFSRNRREVEGVFALPMESGLAVPVDRTDVSLGTELMTELAPNFVLEARGGVEHSVGEWGGIGRTNSDSRIPSTRFVDTGILLGSDPGLAGDVRRSAIMASPVGHLRLGGHSLKLGVAVSVAAHEYEYAPRTAGEFIFASPEALAMGLGSFTGTQGSITSRSFITHETGGFVQHQWEPVRGLEMTTGFRMDWERLPLGDVPLNERWEELTGLRNDSFPDRFRKLSPRVRLSWDLSGDGATVLHGSFGLHHDRFDPGALNEVLSLSGPIQVRREVGSVGRWPLPPSGDDDGAGVALALFGTELEAPRTIRVAGAVSQRFGPRTTLHLSGTFRQTESLLRRSDLNLAIVPSSTRPDGRPIYGKLVQLGSLLTPEPGSNRRFPEFDAVWALHPDGWSRYSGATVALEHQGTDRLRLYAHYTFSRTEDNLFGAGRGLPEAGLPPQLGEDGPSDWVTGRSDFDVPHRASAAALIQIPALQGIDLWGAYRFRSGTPFTPGYRDGVDLTGDGSGYNDPAFVSQEAASAHPCLTNAPSGIAPRNACRTDPRHSFDLGASVGIFQVRSSVASLTVEALNLLDTEMGPPDRALYLIQGENGGPAPVPGGAPAPTFHLNPDFGKTLIPVRAGRTIRLGFKVTLP